MSRRAGWRRFSSEPLEVGEPELDQWSDGVLQARLAGGRERLLVALARLFGPRSLLDAVVARYQQPLNPRPRLFPLHSARLTVQSSRTMEAASVPAAVRVLIADDEPLFAEALEALLAADERIEVVGRAENGQKAVERALTLMPDVILMDISMPVMDGFEATRRIRDVRSSACILMLTGSDSSADVDRARQVGAAAYVTKDRIETDLLDTILDVASR